MDDAEWLVWDVGSALAHAAAGYPTIEDGYSADAGVAANLVAELAALGVGGVNIGDTRSGRLVDPAAVAAKIDAIKRRSPDVFVNARVDNLWFGEQATVDAVLRRARAYAEARPVAGGDLLSAVTAHSGQRYSAAHAGLTKS